MDLELFSRGGLAILDAIEASGYNTLAASPVALEVDASCGCSVRALAAQAFTAFRRPRAGHPAARPSEAGALRARSGTLELSRRIRRPTTSVRPMRNAIGSPVRRTAASISHFSACPGESAMRFARSMLSCGSSTMFRTNPENWNRSDAASRAGARCSIRPSPGLRADHAILPALADTIARFEIPTRYFHDLILGAEMDLTIASYATFDRLSEYCYRVAGTVGLTCLHVFGFRDPRAPDLAERLGLAFQLTNIIRDVRDAISRWAACTCPGRSRPFRRACARNCAAR